MPKLTIDNISIDVPEGTTILEAARSIGIVIPHFCWHPALGKAGACRVCAVKMLDGPVKGIQMSCMLPAQDGMVVSTTDEEAMTMRRSVIEWLMINHPHDCPVCDEGGECQLQDFTIAGGHGIRRYDGLKRTHINQYLGTFIEHEMNRCIQCYRCARFYQEYAGGTDFGVMGRAGTVYFGRQQDGQLESPFSGNLVDICPTGVFTDKTARFRARYWDYDMAPSVCPGCSLGCNTVPMARYRELLKTTARRNEAVNDWFICDRGRFNNAAINAPDRPRQALVDGSPVTLDSALATLADRIEGFLELHGPEALAIVGSPRMDHEGNIMAARLRDLLGGGTLCYFVDESAAAGTEAALQMLSADNGASQRDVRHADLVVIVGCDLLSEAPMMALAVRQAWRNGARVYRIASPLPLGEGQGEGDPLPFEFTNVATLAEIPLSTAQRPVIISGIDQASLSAVHSIYSPPSTKGECELSIKIAFILDGPNAHGCALLARDHGAVPLATALASGTVKGVISFEADIAKILPKSISIIGIADWQPSSLVSRAEVFLPTTGWVEQDGTYINHEGRAQRFKRVMQPGLPIKGLTPELHPPRLHRHDAPGGDVSPAWWLITALMTCLGLSTVEEPLSSCWERLRNLDAESEGRVMLSTLPCPPKTAA